MGRLVSAFFLLTVAAASVPGAALGDDLVRSLCVLCPEESGDCSDLTGALRAHLSGYEVEVEILSVDLMPKGRADQIELARSAAPSGSGTGVLWMDARDGSLVVLPRPRDPAGLVLLRPLPAGDAAHDAAASIARSVLAERLAPRAEEPLDSDDRLRAMEIRDSERPPLEGDDEGPERWSPPLFTMEVRGGYGFSIPGDSGQPQHGARLAVGALLWRHLQIEVGVDALQPVGARLPDTGDRIELWRVPLRLGVAGLLGFSRVELGARVGLAIDFTRIEGVDQRRIEGDPDRVVPGLTAVGFLRVRIVRFLAIWAEGGVDIYRSTYDYTRAGTTVLTYEAVQPLASAGLSFLLKVM
ncbi:MAG: hypothetical protein R6V85_10675 [Polyangia bacterium]